MIKLKQKWVVVQTHTNEVLPFLYETRGKALSVAALAQKQHRGHCDFVVCHVKLEVLEDEILKERSKAEMDEEAATVPHE